MQNAKDGNWSFLSQQSDSNTDLEACNRLQTLEPEPFKQPPPRQTSGSSLSLNSDNDSTPMNLEDELKRRKIIKQSYDGRPYKRITPTGEGKQLEDDMFGVSTISTANAVQKVIVEGLSTLEEEYVDRMQVELHNLLNNWSKCMNKKSPEDNSNTNTTSLTTSREQVSCH